MNLNSARIFVNVVAKGSFSTAAIINGNPCRDDEPTIR